MIVPLARHPRSSSSAGLDQVREIARALYAGEITTKEDAITRAVEAMLAARLTRVPAAALSRASAEVARLAREDPGLRRRVEGLLERLADEVDPTGE